jgi:hypothetical protein
MNSTDGVQVPDMPDANAYDAHFLVGYLLATLQNSGVITVADWTEAVQAAEAEAVRRQESGRG